MLEKKGTSESAEANLHTKSYIVQCWSGARQQRKRKEIVVTRYSDAWLKMDGRKTNTENAGNAR